MKVTLDVIEIEYGGVRHKLSIDGKHRASIGDLCECPEDAMIGRSLIDGQDIINYIQMGYDAAKRGETLEIEIKDSKDDE